MSKRNNKLFMAAVFVLCVLLFMERLTGGVLHAIFGIVLAVMFAVHVCKSNKQMKYRKTSVQAVDWILIAALIVLVVSGILLHPLGGLLILKIIHKLAAVIFVLGLFAHILQHVKKKK